MWNIPAVAAVDLTVSPSSLGWQKCNYLSIFIGMRVEPVIIDSEITLILLWNMIPVLHEVQIFSWKS